MFSKQFISSIAIALSVLSVSEQALGRERWLERDNKPLFLHPRRFGQQNPDVLTRLSSACSGQVCGVLAGNAVSTLLGAAAECTQQDMADSIIDAAQQFDDTTKANMIALAVEFRQVEKNTPPDFTTNPPTNRNSVFCQKAPKNAELNGLVQAQDPANDPNVFFDPATSKSVTLGSQANTIPFGTSGSNASAVDTATPAAASPTAISAIATDGSDDVDCDTSVVTVTVAARAAVDTTGSCSLVTLTLGATDATATADATATGTADATATTAAAVSTAAASNIGDFGSCSVPQIEFGVGFDNRKETSFQPVDKTSFNHGSAQAIGIITQFICDTLTNSCGADQTAKDTCQTATNAANAQTAKTGAQADAFNAAFGITTDFAAVASVDDQGNVIAGTGSGAKTAAAASGAATVAAPTATDSTTPAANTAVASSSNVGDFGSCSVPQIEFGVGFDGRKETSFQPVDKTSFNHGSAQAIGVITQSICDTLTNSCGADQTAKDTCQTATNAANAQTAKTGAQADAFNAAFGITTDFAAVASVDDTGNVIAGTGSGAAAAAAASGAATDSPATATDSTAPAADTAVASSSNVGDFGSCSVPQIEFGVGFDGRKETSFQPVDKTSFNHGSAQAIGIITQFICDTLTNSCGADQTAKDTCQTATNAANAQTAKTGAQADAFNAAFGITTDFSSVAAVDDQGNVVAGGAA